MQNVMMHYAIIIDPARKLENKIIDKLKKEEKSFGISAINHVSAEYVCFSPIGISIETSRAVIEEDTANLQLGT